MLVVVAEPRSVHDVADGGVALSSQALALKPYIVSAIRPVDSQLVTLVDGDSDVDAVIFSHSYLVDASFVPVPHEAVMEDDVIFKKGPATGGWYGKTPFADKEAKDGVQSRSKKHIASDLFIL